MSTSESQIFYLGRFFGKKSRNKEVFIARNISSCTLNFEISVASSFKNVFFLQSAYAGMKLLVLI